MELSAVAQEEIDVVKSLEAGPTEAEIRRRKIVEIDEEVQEERVDCLRKIAIRELTRSIPTKNITSRRQKMHELKNWINRLMRSNDEHVSQRVFNELLLSQGRLTTIDGLKVDFHTYLKKRDDTDSEDGYSDDQSDDDDEEINKEAKQSFPELKENVTASSEAQLPHHSKSTNSKSKLASDDTIELSDSDNDDENTDHDHDSRDHTIQCLPSISEFSCVESVNQNMASNANSAHRTKLMEMQEPQSEVLENSQAVEAEQTHVATTALTQNGNQIAINQTNQSGVSNESPNEFPQNREILPLVTSKEGREIEEKSEEVEVPKPITVSEVLRSKYMFSSTFISTSAEPSKSITSNKSILSRLKLPAAHSARTALKQTLIKKVLTAGKDNLCKQMNIRSDQLALFKEVVDNCRMFIEIIRDREDRIARREKARAESERLRRRQQFMEQAYDDDEEFDEDAAGVGENEMTEGEKQRILDHFKDWPEGEEEGISEDDGSSCEDNEADEDDDSRVLENDKKRAEKLLKSIERTKKIPRGHFIHTHDGEDNEADNDSQGFSRCSDSSTEIVDSESTYRNPLTTTPESTNGSYDLMNKESQFKFHSEQSDKNGSKQIARMSAIRTYGNSKRRVPDDLEENGTSTDISAVDDSSVSIHLEQNENTKADIKRLSTVKEAQNCSEEDSDEDSSIIAAENKPAGNNETSDGSDNSRDVEISVPIAATAVETMKRRPKQSSEYRRLVEEEERRSRVEKTLRSNLMEMEAEEDEEEGAQAGLGDFGFGVSKAKDDDEADALRIRQGDFDNIVDDLSDGEGDEDAAIRARADLERKEDIEQTKQVIAAVTEGHALNRNRNKGKYTFDKLIRGRDEEELERRFDVNGNGVDGEDEELDEFDEEEMLQRGLQAKAEREMHSRALLADSDNEDYESSDEEDDADLNPDLDEDAKQVLEEQKKLRRELQKREAIKIRQFAMQAKIRRTFRRVQSDSQKSINGGSDIIRPELLLSHPSQVLSLDDPFVTSMNFSASQTNVDAPFASNSNNPLTDITNTQNSRDAYTNSNNGPMPISNSSVPVKRRTSIAPKHFSKNARLRGPTVPGLSSTTNKLNHSTSTATTGLYCGSLNAAEVACGYGMGMAVTSAGPNTYKRGFQSHFGPQKAGGSLFDSVTGAKRIMTSTGEASNQLQGHCNSIAPKRRGVGASVSAVAASQFIFVGQNIGNSSSGFVGEESQHFGIYESSQSAHCSGSNSRNGVGNGLSRLGSSNSTMGFFRTSGSSNQASLDTTTSHKTSSLFAQLHAPLRSDKPK